MNHKNARNPKTMIIKRDWIGYLSDLAILPVAVIGSCTSALGALDALSAAIISPCTGALGALGAAIFSPCTGTLGALGTLGPFGAGGFEHL